MKTFYDLEKNINPKNINAEAQEILRRVKPDWTEQNNINLKIFSDGITNKMFGFYYGSNLNDTVLIRINGNKTDIFLDRKKEVESFIMLHNAQCAPELYGVFANGLCFEYIPGVTLTKDSVRNPTVYRVLTKELAKMHNIKLPTDNGHKNPMLFSKIDQFLYLAFSDDAPTGKTISPPYSEGTLKTELSDLKEHLVALNSPVVFSHNDILLNNVIYDPEKERVKFIDYEYAAANYEAFDIGNHFCEFAGVDDVDYSLYPDKNLQLDWLRCYLTERKRLSNCSDSVTNSEVEKLYVQVNKFALASHFFWGIWSLVQAKYSVIDFDFLQYSKKRLDEYFAKKESMLSLQLS